MYQALLFDEIEGWRLYSSVRENGTVWVRENHFRESMFKSIMFNVAPEDVERAKFSCWCDVRDMIYNGE